MHRSEVTRISSSSFFASPNNPPLLARAASSFKETLRVLRLRMRRTLVAGLLLIALTGGCARVQPMSSTAPPGGPEVVAPVATPVTTPVAAPVAAIAAPDAAPQPTEAPVLADANPAAGPAATAPAPPAPPAPNPVVNAKDKPAFSAAAPKQPAPPKPPAPPSKPVVAVAPPPPPPPPAPPALNLSSLEQRLRDTHAIGVFTKLSLKNQVDDLLDQFRAFYRGQVAIPLTTLRQRYDLLMLKVLSLLQDSDPALANDIVASREAIWGILRDPQKFASI